MRSPFFVRNREAIGGLLIFGLVALIIGCGGGGGGGGGTVTGTNTNTNTSTTATNGGNTTTNTTTGTTGSLFPDQIFYSISDGSGKTIFRIQPNGSGNTVFADLPPDFPNAAINETGTMFGFFREIDVNPDPNITDIRYNLWRNTTLSATGAVRLTPQNATNNFFNFLHVGTIQFTPDGSSIVFTAARTENDFGIYIADVTPDGTNDLIRLANGEEAYLTGDGLRIVTTQVVGGAGDIVTMNLINGGTAVSGAVNLTQGSAAEDFMPQWSKDGDFIVFSSDRNGGQFDVFRMASNGSSVTLLVGTAEDEYGPSLNEAATHVAYTILSGDIDSYGVYVKQIGGGAGTALALDSAVGTQVFWTPAAPPPPGRSAAAMAAGVQLGQPMRPRLHGR